MSEPLLNFPVDLNYLIYSYCDLDDLGRLCALQDVDCHRYLGVPFQSFWCVVENKINTKLGWTFERFVDNEYPVDFNMFTTPSHWIRFDDKSTTPSHWIRFNDKSEKWFLDTDIQEENKTYRERLHPLPFGGCFFFGFHLWNSSGACGLLVDAHSSKGVTGVSYQVEKQEISSYNPIDLGWMRTELSGTQDEVVILKHRNREKKPTEFLVTTKDCAYKVYYKVYHWSAEKKLEYLRDFLLGKGEEYEDIAPHLLSDGAFLVASTKNGSKSLVVRKFFLNGKKTQFKQVQLLFGVSEHRRRIISFLTTDLLFLVDYLEHQPRSVKEVKVWEISSSRFCTLAKNITKKMNDVPCFKWHPLFPKVVWLAWMQDSDRGMTTCHLGIWHLNEPSHLTAVIHTHVVDPDEDWENNISWLYVNPKTNVVGAFQGYQGGNVNPQRVWIFRRVGV